MSIWLFYAGGRYTSFIPDDLKYFWDHFTSKPLRANWKIPPAKPYGVSKPLPDFATWHMQAPVVSERARSLIEQLAGADVESLDFHPLKDKPYYALNVLRCEDYLDKKKSNLDFTEPKYVFRNDIPERLPPIFKCPGASDLVFVTASFGEMIVHNKLKGAVLADPTENHLMLAAMGEPANRYPGLIT